MKDLSASLVSDSGVLIAGLRILTALPPPCQVCEKPLMYLVDTPGVLPPRLGDLETGMKLALCGEVASVARGTSQMWL